MHLLSFVSLECDTRENTSHVGAHLDVLMPFLAPTGAFHVTTTYSGSFSLFHSAQYHSVTTVTQDRYSSINATESSSHSYCDGLSEKVVADLYWRIPTFRAPGGANKERALIMTEQGKEAKKCILKKLVIEQIGALCLPATAWVCSATMLHGKAY